MIFRKRTDVLQHPLEVLEHPNLPGIFVVDGLIKQDFLREKYEFFLRECDWRMEINSGKSQGTTYPADRLPDTIGNNKMWGFSIFEEHCEPPYVITSTDGSIAGDSKYQWIFDMVSYITQQLGEVPFEVWSIHMNGQTSNLDAAVHADTGDNLIIYLTPDWKPEWGGEIAFYNGERDETPIQTVDYVSGRIVFFHGVVGHREGYPFAPRFINEKPVWHQGRGPNENCHELRISLNVRGKWLYEGAPINASDPRDGMAEDHRTIRKQNKNLLEEEGE